jgi:hypothetical protein
MARTYSNDTGEIIMQKKPLTDLLKTTTKGKTFSDADKEHEEYKKQIKELEELKQFKRAGRKLSAGEKRTEKVFVSFAPSEFLKLRTLMKKQGKEYQPIAEFIRETLLDFL